MSVKAGDTPVLSMFAQDNVVILQSIHSKRTIRIIESPDKTTTQTAWATGKKDDPDARFIVHVRRPGIIALQSFSKPECWLTIKDDKTNGNGDGGSYCEFIITESEGMYIALESVEYPGQHVGFMSKGKPMGPRKIGVTDRGRFIPFVHTHARVKPKQASPPPAPTPDPVPPAIDGLPRAGDTPLLALFTEGALVLLQSRSSGKNLRVANGEVEGLGGKGQYAQFRVHVRRPRIVALESVAISGKYLTINQQQTTINGPGRFSDLLLKEVGEGYLCLESMEHPGQHIGILPNGDVMPPANTNTQHHSQFKPILHMQSPPPPAQTQPQETSSLQAQYPFPQPPAPQVQNLPGGQQQPPYPPGGQQQPPYPSGGQQQPPYPPGSQQQPPYPPGGQPQPPYPPGGQPQPSYPPGGQPQPSYPPGSQPQPSYPPGSQPQPPYPPGGQPQPSYPPGSQPQPSYPPGGRQQFQGPPPQAQSQYDPPPAYQSLSVAPTQQPLIGNEVTDGQVFNGGGKESFEDTVGELERTPSPPVTRRQSSAPRPEDLVDYAHEPVEPDAKFPENDMRKIVQNIGIQTNNLYLIISCIDVGAVKRKCLSLKPGGRLFKAQIKPVLEEAIPWEFTSTSDGKHFTLRSRDESGNVWYFARLPKCAPAKDPSHAALFGFEEAPDGAKDEFQIYHHDPTQHQKMYLIMSSDGKSILLSESSEASRWQVVPHDPRSGTHGIECNLYIHNYERNDPIFCQDARGSQTKITKAVQYSTGFDKSIETTDLCGWEKAKESTHSADVGASIGAAFNLFSVAFNANYGYSTTSSKSQFQEKQTTKGLVKQEATQETTTYEIAPGEEIYQKILVLELFRAWSAKETGLPFFIEKRSSLDNRTATIIIRKARHH